MALHFLGTAWHVVQIVQHTATGNVPAAAAESIKAAASLIPGGGILTNLYIGAVTDEILVNHNTNLAAHLSSNAVNSVGDWVDNFGDADGIAEFSDIIEGIGNLFG
jgi:hypothetical protein